MTPRGHRAVALVESPAQLLNAIEWAWADASGRASGKVRARGRFGGEVAIRVLAPMDPTGRVQLHRMTEFARSNGFDIGWHEVRGRVPARLQSVATVAAEIARAETVVVGDPFSTTIQFLVGLVGPARIVVVDDGSATLEFVEIIREGRGLVRWHRVDESSPPARLVASLARRRMLPSGARATDPAPDRLRLYTSMPVSNTALRVDHNELAWIRRRFGPPKLINGAADIVGTSLVESRIVDEEHYLRAVGMLADTHHAHRYFAHRRESVAKLARIEQLGLEIVRPDLPLEIFARVGPSSAKIISFPSTVVHTLPLALSDTDIEVLVCDIEQQWFRAGQAGSRIGRFLTSVADSARRTHGLNAADTG